MTDVDQHGYLVQPSSAPFGHYDAHRHRNYLLTCAEYDDLLIRSGRRCELCAKSEGAKRWQRLCIDHDHDIGQWAVRGLLCNRCNSQLGKRSPHQPQIAQYLANAWHLTHKPQVAIA